MLGRASPPPDPRKEPSPRPQEIFALWGRACPPPGKASVLRNRLAFQMRACPRTGAYGATDVATPALVVARSRGVDAYGLGSRVPWVVAAGPGGVSARAIHPNELTERRLPLDAAHYIERVDAVLATLLAPIMASRQHVNASMCGDGTVVLRAEARKGDRDAVCGMSAARRFLAVEAASRPVHGAEQLTLAPPDVPAHTLVKRKGVLMLRVLGDVDGRAWATGSVTALASLPWQSVKWKEADGRIITGRAVCEESVQGGWDARVAEVGACYTRAAGWVGGK